MSRRRELLEQAGALVERQLAQCRAADAAGVVEHRRHVEAGAADADDGLAGHGVGHPGAVVRGGEPPAGDVALEHRCGHRVLSGLRCGRLRSGQVRRPENVTVTTASARSRRGQVAVRAVPLGERVDGAEQQPAGDGGIDVGPHVALVLGGADQPGDDPVELAAPLQRRPLDLGVAAQPQQQGDERQLGGEHAHRAADDVLEPVDRRAGGRAGLLGDGEQRVQRAVERQPQQVPLARHVVVDRRLGDAEPGGQLVHAGRLVAALVEHRDGDVEQRVQRVTRGGRGVPGCVRPRCSCAAAHRFRSSCSRCSLPTERVEGVRVDDGDARR